MKKIITLFCNSFKIYFLQRAMFAMFDEANRQIDECESVDDVKKVLARVRERELYYNSECERLGWPKLKIKI